MDSPITFRTALTVMMWCWAATLVLAPACYCIGRLRDRRAAARRNARRLARLADLDGEPPQLQGRQHRG